MFININIFIGDVDCYNRHSNGCFINQPSDSVAYVVVNKIGGINSSFHQCFINDYVNGDMCHHYSILTCEKSINAVSAVVVLGIGPERQVQQQNDSSCCRWYPSSAICGQAAVGIRLRLTDQYLYVYEANYHLYRQIINDMGVLLYIDGICFHRDCRRDKIKSIKKKLLNRLLNKVVGIMFRLSKAARFVLDNYDPCSHQRWCNNYLSRRVLNYDDYKIGVILARLLYNYRDFDGYVNAAQVANCIEPLNNSVNVESCKYSVILNNWGYTSDMLTNVTCIMKPYIFVNEIYKYVNKWRYKIRVNPNYCYSYRGTKLLSIKDVSITNVGFGIIRWLLFSLCIHSASATNGTDTNNVMTNVAAALVTTAVITNIFDNDEVVVTPVMNTVPVLAFTNVQDAVSSTMAVTTSFPVDNTVTGMISNPIVTNDASIIGIGTLLNESTGKKKRKRLETPNERVQRARCALTVDERNRIK